MQTPRIVRFLIVCFAVGALMSPAPAAAGFLAVHDTVLADTSSGEMSGSGTGALDVTSGWADGSNDTATGRAATGGTAGTLLRTMATYTAPNWVGFTSISNASATAMHTDIAYVGGPGQHPDYIQLYFHVDGRFYFTIYDTGVGSSITDMFLNINADAGAYGLGVNNATTVIHDDTGTTVYPQVGYSGDWDSVHFDGAFFDGIFHITVPYDETVNGYAWDIQMQSLAHGASSGGTTDFFNTTSLTAATLLDGTTPVDVTFDSGIQLPGSGNAVASPAPPGLLLALSGIASLGGFGWIRRRKAIATA